MAKKTSRSAASGTLLPPTPAERRRIAENTPTKHQKAEQGRYDRARAKEKDAAERLRPHPSAEHPSNRSAGVRPKGESPMARKLSRVNNVATEPLADAYKAQQTLFPRYATRDLPKAHRDYLGLIVYDTTQEALLICNGAAWKPIIISQSPD